MRFLKFLFPLTLGIVVCMTFLLSCGGGGGSTDSDVIEYSQADLTGTWQEDINGRYISFDEQGSVNEVIKASQEILYEFDGAIHVNYPDGEISGYVYLDHSHFLDGSNRHSHDIDYSGMFSSYDLITGSWMVAGAGSGDFTWERLL